MKSKVRFKHFVAIEAGIQIKSFVLFFRNLKWKRKVAIYISSYLRLHHLWLPSEKTELRVCVLVGLGSKFTTERCPDSLGQLAFLSVSAFRESEGDGGTAIVRDCTTEWRNVLTLGTQKYFSCK